MSRNHARNTFAPARQLRLPNDFLPILSVVIDTEEEFDWSAPFHPGATATTNIRYQPLAQAVFDRHGVVPTYVIDYPVAASAEARAVLRGFADAGRAEIGAHLHPWVNPPTGAPVDAYHSYPGNLSAEQEHAKLAALTDCIADGFGRRPTIYKAGRYGLGPATDGILAELGYRIDTSIVPHTDFSSDGGPDFTGLPNGPFVTKAGVLALPLSVHFAGCLAACAPRFYPRLTGHICRRLHLPGIAARLRLLERLRLSPEHSPLVQQMRHTRAALAQGERFFMLTYHSSSLLPGATPYVRSEQDRGRFLEALDGYLGFFLSACGGRTAPLSAIAASFLAGAGAERRKT